MHQAPTRCDIIKVVRWIVLESPWNSGQEKGRVDERLSNETQEIRVQRRTPQASLKPSTGGLFVQDKCSIVTSAAETGCEPGSMPRHSGWIYTAKASDPCWRPFLADLFLLKRPRFEPDSILCNCTNKSHLHKAEYHRVCLTWPKGKYII